MDELIEFLFTFGRFSPAVLIVGGWAWLLVMVWRQNTLWGMFGLFFWPAVLGFALRNFEQSRWPLTILIAGFVLVFLANKSHFGGGGLADIMHEQARVMQQNQSR